jgi:hypothetical protein
VFQFRQHCTFPPFFPAPATEKKILNSVKCRILSMYNIYSLALHFLLSLLISPSAPLSLASPSFPSSVFLSFFICFLHLLPGSPIFFLPIPFSFYSFSPIVSTISSSASVYLLLPSCPSSPSLSLVLILFLTSYSFSLLLPVFLSISAPSTLFFFLSFILILSPSLAFFSLSSFFRLYPPSPLGSNWSVQ